MSTRAKWSQEELAILKRWYSDGPVRTSAKLAEAGFVRDADAVQVKANKMGWSCRKPRILTDLPASNGGPGRYVYEFEPLLSLPALPRRPGADDYKRLPSLKT